MKYLIGFLTTVCITLFLIGVGLTTYLYLNLWGPQEDIVTKIAKLREIHAVYLPEDFQKEYPTDSASSPYDTLYDYFQSTNTNLSPLFINPDDVWCECNNGDTHRYHCVQTLREILNDTGRMTFEIQTLADTLRQIHAFTHDTRRLDTPAFSFIFIDSQNSNIHRRFNCMAKCAQLYKNIAHFAIQQNLGDVLVGSISSLNLLEKRAISDPFMINYYIANTFHQDKQLIIASALHTDSLKLNIPQLRELRKSLTDYDSAFWIPPLSQIIITEVSVNIHDYERSPERFIASAIQIKRMQENYELSLKNLTTWERWRYTQNAYQNFQKMLAVSLKIIPQLCDSQQALIFVQSAGKESNVPLSFEGTRITEEFLMLVGLPQQILHVNADLINEIDKKIEALDK